METPFNMLIVGMTACGKTYYLLDTLEKQYSAVDTVLVYVTETFKGSNTLIILDDCASGQDVKSRTNQLVNLAFSARQFGLSTIVVEEVLSIVNKLKNHKYARLDIMLRHLYDNKIVVPQ